MFAIRRTTTVASVSRNEARTCFRSGGSTAAGWDLEIASNAAPVSIARMQSRPVDKVGLLHASRITAVNGLPQIIGHATDFVTGYFNE
jgi:hypothetical protein